MAKYAQVTAVAQPFLPRKTVITVRTPCKAKLERCYHPEKHPLQDHHCIVSGKVVFSLAVALVAWIGRHLGTSQWAPPLPLPFTLSSCRTL